MTMILNYLCLGLDYLLSFILIGLSAVGGILPRCPVKPVIPDTPGFAMVQKLGLGWNLGCSLESMHTYEDGTYETGLKTETMWGNARTTRAVMETLYESGFRTVRIPTAWSNHMDAEGGIDPEWLARVREVVDYAYDTGLYVILNTHNDEFYNYTLDPAKEAATTEWYKNTWRQIAEEFKGYGERLLFEAVNEPRTVGSRLEWNGGLVAERQVLNRLHAAFVETVRASGGNNAERWLLLPTHGASADPVAMRSLCLPKDDKLIVSVHAYVPWEYSHVNDKASPEKDNAYTKAGQRTVTRTMENIYRAFISKGIPVYLGNSARRQRTTAPTGPATRRITSPKQQNTVCAAPGGITACCPRRNTTATASVC